MQVSSSLCILRFKDGADATDLVFEHYERVDFISSLFDTVAQVYDREVRLSYVDELTLNGKKINFPISDENIAAADKFSKMATSRDFLPTFKSSWLYKKEVLPVE